MSVSIATKGPVKLQGQGGKFYDMKKPGIYHLPEEFKDHWFLTALQTSGKVDILSNDSPADVNIEGKIPEGMARVKPRRKAAALVNYSGEELTPESVEEKSKPDGEEQTPPKKNAKKPGA